MGENNILPFLVLRFLSYLCSLISSVTQSCPTLWSHGLQHTRLPCPSPTPGACSNTCPLSHWCHQTISSSIIPFSSHLQTFPAPGSFPITQFFTSNGQSIGVSSSASVLPMNIQDWFPLGWTGWISLQSKGFSRVFSNTTVQKHQLFFCSCGEQGLLFSFGIWVSHCSVFLLQSTGSRAHGLSACSSWALEHSFNSCGAWG